MNTPELRKQYIFEFTSLERATLIDFLAGIRMVNFSSDDEAAVVYTFYQELRKSVSIGDA